MYKKNFKCWKKYKKSNDGIFKSFIDKTPFQYPAKIKKNINRSYDNARKEHDIFLRDKNDDSKTFRIFGEERKKINKNPNYESEVPKFKFYRKLFWKSQKYEKYLFINRGLTLIFNFLFLISIKKSLIYNVLYIYSK